MSPVAFKIWTGLLAEIIEKAGADPFKNPAG